MRPKAEASDGAQVVLYIDANMPELRKCRRGCASASNYMCVHRFGPRIWIVGDPGWLSFTRQSDLQVVLDFIYTINRRWLGCRSRKRFVIVTHDERFLAAAREQHASQRNMRQLPLVWGRDWVQFEHGKRSVRVEVRRILAQHSNRHADLAEILKIGRSLRASL